MSGATPSPVVRTLGRVSYEETYARMRRFTAGRGAHTADEIWLLEHPRVFTAGVRAHAGAAAEIEGIPVVRCDRGGELTYHGPGQLVVYVMIDLIRLRLGASELVRRLESAVIDLLAGHGIAGERRPAAPGVYVDGRKLASLGLRVRRGATYHGLALNVHMDLAPFRHIVACGLVGIEAAQLSEFVPGATVADVGPALADKLRIQLGYNAPTPMRAEPNCAFPARPH